VAIIGLLAALATTAGLAQTAQDLGPRPIADQAPAAPPSGQSPPVAAVQSPSTGPSQGQPGEKPTQGPPWQEPGVAETDDKSLGEPIDLESTAKLPPTSSLSDFLGYRYNTSSLQWIPGGGNQFGMFSIEWDHYQQAGIKNGLGFGAAFNFLSGPDDTDMPARTYDFSLAYQMRNRLGPLGFDVAASVLAASDFEGSARRGILFPGHAVGFFSVNPALDLVLGVDYLDRGDIKLLPVGGAIWVPKPEMRFEIVFPRPRFVYQLTDRYFCYLSGELGGGTGAIQRPVVGNDLATYRDLRLCVGLEYLSNDAKRADFEIGYLFDRRIEYTSGIGDMPLDDAVMFSLLTRY
jgi:hypothetical protein